MKIKTAGILQYPLHLDESYRHVDQIILCRLATDISNRIKVLVKFGKPVVDLIVPFILDLVGRPYVMEGSAFRGCADRRMEIASLVKWRIQINKVNGIAVDTPQDREVVVTKKCSGRKIGGGVDHL